MDEGIVQARFRAAFPNHLWITQPGSRYTRLEYRTRASIYFRDSEHGNIARINLSYVHRFPEALRDYLRTHKVPDDGRDYLIGQEYVEGVIDALTVEEQSPNPVYNSKEVTQDMEDRLDHLKYDSIRDVVSILDSALLKGNELMPEYRAMQIANRALIAHHAIEKGLKARLTRAGVSYSKRNPEGHDLSVLYQRAKKIEDGNWAKGLAHAFEDAVRYYEYDVSMLPHLETLETYFLKIGSGKAFSDMRYWLDDPDAAPTATDLIHHIILLLHKEILEALWHLVGFDRYFVVSQRVEQAVIREIELALGHSPGTPSEQAYRQLVQWLQSYPDCQTALREAVQQGYLVEGVDELGRERIRQAFERLTTSDNPTMPPPSEDPAVAFFITSCGDIQPGSQTLYSDADVQVEWLNQDQTSAKVLTPGRETLGFISRHAQSRWTVQSLWNNSGAHSKSFEELKRWLVAQHCKQVSLVTDGTKRHLYIFSNYNFFPSRNMAAWTGEVDVHKPQEFELGFWDVGHGLQPGQKVNITLRYVSDSNVGNRLEGVVDRVDRHCVWIKGQNVIDIID